VTLCPELGDLVDELGDATAVDRPEIIGDRSRADLGDDAHD
jgi:hypothetical protein